MAHINRPTQRLYIPNIPNHLTHYSGSLFKDQAAFCTHPIHKILAARSSDMIHIELVYTNIDPSWAMETANSLHQKRKLKCL